MSLARIAVPTATVIGNFPNDIFTVAVIRPKNKHDGRLVLPGGCLNLEKKETPEQVAMREWDEEVGGEGSYLQFLKLWTIKTDPLADVRTSTLGKLTHGECPTELAETPVIGHYGCPDWIFRGEVVGTPSPKDGEAEECIWFNLRELKISPTVQESQFGANHDLILGIILFRYLYGINLSRASDAHLTDMAELRQFLRRHQPLA
ncbi:MAG: NUDIX domain-containing protein [Candidatus Paceibacterales bacterium]